VARRDQRSAWPFWEAFDGPASAFLVAIFSGALRIGMFPYNFPSEAPEFEVAAA
jgi:hypothetical protein